MSTATPGPSIVRRAKEIAESTGCTVIRAFPGRNGVSVELGHQDMQYLSIDLGCDTTAYDDAEGFTYLLAGIRVHYWSKRAA